MTILPIVSILPLLGACEYPAKTQRLWEMVDHETALYEAGHAISQGNLAGVRAAGASLARPDPVPGLPEGALLYLGALRAAGQELASAPSIDAGAGMATALTVQCAGCHSVLKVSPVSPLGSGGDEALWNALAFQDAGAFEAAAQEWPALRGVEGWDARREAFARALQERRR